MPWAGERSNSVACIPAWAGLRNGPSRWIPSTGERGSRTRSASSPAARAWTSGVVVTIVGR